jgi:hypothetical protein
MVLDCTSAQRRAIEDVLAAAHRRGDIVYGMQRSDSALMTCLTRGTCISSTGPTAVLPSPPAPRRHRLRRVPTRLE